MQNIATNVRPHLSSLKAAGWVTLVFYLLPVLFCAIDRIFLEYPIGPLVLFFSFAVMFGSIPLYFRALSSSVRTLLAGLFALALSAASGIVMLNYFMWLTSVFGVMDYAPL